MNFLKIGCTLAILFLYTLASAQSKKPTANDHYAKIETNLGEMIFKLSAETPKHTANFIRLAKKGYYDTYSFNRVIRGFVIQGGETDSAYAAMEKSGQQLKRISPEFSAGLFHQRGALAAGRDDNKEKSSFLGQFYLVDGKKYTDVQLDAFEKRIGTGFRFSASARDIYKNVGGTPSLDQNYTVFGHLIKGWEVLDLIAGQQKDKSDRPITPVVIKVTVFSKKQNLR